MTTTVTNKTFSGNSKTYSQAPDGLGQVLAGILKVQGKQAAATVSALTDDSAGTSGGATVAAIPSSFVASEVSGTNLAPKAGWDTAWGEVRNAVSTLAAQFNAINDVVPVLDGGLTDSTGGTSGAGTVGAITQSLTAVTGASNTALAQDQSTKDIAVAQANVSELVFWVNRMCVATGTAELTDDTGAMSTLHTGTLAAMHATSDAGVTGATADAVLNTAADAFLVAAANAVATVAAKLNAIVAHTGQYLTLSAVAGS